MLTSTSLSDSLSAPLASRITPGTLSTLSSASRTFLSCGGQGHTAAARFEGWANAAAESDTERRPRWGRRGRGGKEGGGALGSSSVDAVVVRGSHEAARAEGRRQGLVAASAHRALELADHALLFRELRCLLLESILSLLPQPLLVCPGVSFGEQLRRRVASGEF